MTGIFARDPKIVAKWLLGSFSAGLHKHGYTFATYPVSIEHSGQLIDLFTSGYINMESAREVLDIMLTRHKEQAK